MDESRRDELLGAALGGDLTPEERRELDALLQADPVTRAELHRTESVVHALGRAGFIGSDHGWREASPPPALVQRQRPDPPPVTDTPGRPRWKRPLLLTAAALALVGVGAGAAIGAASMAGRPPQGPAGALGAVEPIAFRSVPLGVEVDAAVVAHSWGTETVFERISGLDPGQVYDVVLLAEDGSEVPAGSFEAVEEPVECRMTAATMRADVRAVSVRTATGREVMSSTLPDVLED